MHRRQRRGSKLQRQRQCSLLKNCLYIVIDAARLMFVWPYFHSQVKFPVHEVLVHLFLHLGLFCHSHYAPAFSTLTNCRSPLTTSSIWVCRKTTVRIRRTPLIKAFVCDNLTLFSCSSSLFLPQNCAHTHTHRHNKYTQTNKQKTLTKCHGIKMK